MANGTPASMTWKLKRKLLKYFVPSIRRHPEWPVIISEGDSWFSFPIHKNIVDFLDDIAKREISLLRLEKTGDEALRIIGGKQKEILRNRLARFPVQALLFSGGGNEVVGRELVDLLRTREEGMGWEECIDRSLALGRIGMIKQAYRGLIALRDDCRPECRIYVHGYDYAIPSGKPSKMWGIKLGPWMRPHLEARGILDPGDQRRVIRWLIDRFNEMLADLAAAHRGVVHVKTRRTLRADEWNDELHPSRRGFEKLALKFARALAKQFPETF